MLIEKFIDKKTKSKQIKIVIDLNEAKLLFENFSYIRWPMAAVKPKLVGIIGRLNQGLRKHLESEFIDVSEIENRRQKEIEQQIKEFHGEF